MIIYLLFLIHLLLFPVQLYYSNTNPESRAKPTSQPCNSKHFLSWWLDETINLADLRQTAWYGFNKMTAPRTGTVTFEAIFIARQHATTYRARYCCSKSVRPFVSHTLVLYENECTYRRTIISSIW